MRCWGAAGAQLQFFSESTRLDWMREVLELAKKDDLEGAPHGVGLAVKGLQCSFDCLDDGQLNRLLTAAIPHSIVNGHCLGAFGSAFRRLAPEARQGLVWKAVDLAARNPQAATEAIIGLAAGLVHLAPEDRATLYEAAMTLGGKGGTLARAELVAQDPNESESRQVATTLLIENYADHPPEFRWHQFDPLVRAFPRMSQADRDRVIELLGEEQGGYATINAGKLIPVVAGLDDNASMGKLYDICLRTQWGSKYAGLDAISRAFAHLKPARQARTLDLIEAGLGESDDPSLRTRAIEALGEVAASLRSVPAMA